MDELVIEKIAKRIWQHCEDYNWGNGKSMLCRLDFERIIREELTRKQPLESASAVDQIPLPVRNTAVSFGD